ncbi:BrnT family toxin [Vogesella fluminis]|uniref:BrnT family toxin n=1 Tax=Vogesella fluminis TaxID=1069161 RepID=A0ABQ3HF94_9NEIS|nr:BrnT family toxin [Vogesella fluminis]GHD82284.1 hypothetical protein GCM10011419_29600 [Vogesella fluminis]
MEIDFDPAKNERNIRERGLPFTQVAEFDFSSASVVQDTRKAYPETRYIAIGYLFQRLHVLVFCETERGIRVISLRKANAREVKSHEQTHPAHR